MVQTIIADLVVGQLSKVRTAMKQIYECETEARNQMANNDSLIHTLQLSLVPIDSVLYSATPTDSFNLTLQKADIISTIISLSNQGNISAAKYKECKDARIHDALDLNDAVDARETIELNEKDVNGIVLFAELNGNDSLNSTQIETLHSIANQCPYSGGRAVLTARAKLYSLRNSVVYDDDEICETARYASQLKNNEEVKILRVVPNPSKDFSIISLSYPVQEDATLFIYNSYGQLVSEKQLLPNFTEIKLNLTSFSSGVYHFALNTFYKQIGIGKLTVIR